MQPLKHFACALFLYFPILLVLNAKNPVTEEPNGVLIVTIDQPKEVNQMAVYPKNGIPGRPLLIVAHGHGGSGPKEIAGWIDLAQKNNFTVVCPTFLSAIHSVHVPEDVDYFKDCLGWIQTNLQYDKSNAYMTGFSGGGYAVWYLATQHPDFFKGLFLQSGNFAGQFYALNLPAWRDKPIHLIWGTEDSPTVMAQNRQAVQLLQSEHFTNFSIEITPGAHHEPHHDLVVKWILQLTAARLTR